MRKIVLVTGLLLVSSPVLAQQAPLQPNPLISALYSRLGAEIQNNVQAQAYILQLQAKLRADEDELAKLKANK